MFLAVIYSGMKIINFTSELDLCIMDSISSLYVYWKMLCSCITVRVAVHIASFDKCLHPSQTIGSLQMTKCLHLAYSLLIAVVRCVASKLSTKWQRLTRISFLKNACIQMKQRQRGKDTDCMYVTVTFRQLCYGCHVKEVILLPYRG